jgi:D-alanyl-D-alanine carboxypeptidase/D-alanyl-D-alanine-endopeptidase (penicillin-binding protein 4)
MKFVALACPAVRPLPLLPSAVQIGLVVTLGAQLVIASCAPSPSQPAPPPSPLPTAAKPENATPTPARPDAVAELRHSIDSLLDDPRFHNAFWGVLIVDPASGDTLYARNAHRLFLPASNMKVITSSVALTQLGPDFRFHTAFVARGRVHDSTLVGDLVVIGRGDPTVSDHMLHDAMIPMRAAADSLAAHGIRRITGHIVSGGDAFPDADVGFGWAWDDLTQPYAAGVDELMFNEGFTAIAIRAPRRPGSRARITTAPIADYPRVVSRVTSAAPGGAAPTTELTAAFDPIGGALVVDGTLAPGDTNTLLVAYPDPAAAYLHALAGALRQRGIHLRTAPVAVAADPAPALRTEIAPAAHAAVVATDTVFTMASPPLRDILPALLKPSQNQIAEIFLKTLGLERTGIGSADSGRRVVETQLVSWGVPPDEFVIRDGSGLSRHDYLAPATLVRVLNIMQHDTAFHALYDALPVAGVDGTISDRMRGTAAAGNVHAKTGFVDRARSLSGYVTTADGVTLIFSFLCNNWTVPVHDVEQVQDAIAVRLASMSLGHH